MLNVKGMCIGHRDRCFEYILRGLIKSSVWTGEQVVLEETKKGPLSQGEAGGLSQ